jgi:dTDP-glucose 4,6-dehydratase
MKGRMNLLVTGGAGFIGSHYVRLALARYPSANIVVLDALTYAGNLSTMKDFLGDPRVRFVKGQIQNAKLVDSVFSDFDITHVVNFAAESHNDRSLLASGRFIQTNTLGVYVLLEAVREHRCEKMVHVSTDEVYGSVDKGHFTEESPLQPNTPYSASKAGGDLQCRAHHISFKTPVVVTRGGNNYGPFQYPEKLISYFTVRLIDKKKVPLYGEGHQVREFIHVMDHCEGIDLALREGKVGEAYNIGDKNERRNIDTVRVLLDELGLDENSIKKIPDPRKGAHDARYSMSTKKIGALGWKPTRDFDTELRATVKWYVENQWWWRPIVRKHEYQEFIQAFYGPGLGADL